MTGVRNVYADERYTGESECANGEVIIGEYDGLLSSGYKVSSRTARSISNVRINSYATYSNSGINVYVKLYVPAYESPQPEFTLMAGTVETTMKNKKTVTKTFLKTAQATATISTSVATGVKGDSGERGIINISGTAYSNNAIAGGPFAINYPIVIP